jgi:hypothetical protein
MLAESTGQVQRPSWLLPPDPNAGAARVQQRGSRGNSSTGGEGPSAFFDASTSDSVAERRRERSKFFDPLNGIRVSPSQDSHPRTAEEQESAQSSGLWQQAKTGSIPSRTERLATVPAEISQSIPYPHQDMPATYNSAPQITTESWTSPRPDLMYAPRADQPYAVDSAARAIPEYQPVVERIQEPSEDQRRLIVELQSEVHDERWRAF